MAQLSIVLSAARSSTPGNKLCSSGRDFAGTGDCHEVSSLIRRELPTLWKGSVLRRADRSHRGPQPLHAAQSVPNCSTRVGSVIAGREEFTYNPVGHEACEPRQAATCGATTYAIQFH